MQIVLNLQGHRLLAGIRQTLSSGSKEVDEIKLEVDETWKGFGKIAVFCVGKKCQYTVVDEVTQTAKIPAEVLRNEAVITIGIVGFKDEAVMTSTLVAYQVEKGSVVTIEDPEPSIYAEILSRYADLATRFNNIIANAGDLTNNTELIDARVGADGVVYDTLGEAIRGQVGSLSEDIPHEILSRFYNNGFTVKDRQLFDCYNYIKYYNKYKKADGSIISNKNIFGCAIEINGKVGDTYSFNFLDLDAEYSGQWEYVQMYTSDKIPDIEDIISSDEEGTTSAYGHKGFCSLKNNKKYLIIAVATKPLSSMTQDIFDVLSKKLVVRKLPPDYKNYYDETYYYYYNLNVNKENLSQEILDMLEYHDIGVDSVRYYPSLVLKTGNNLLSSDTSVNLGDGWAGDYEGGFSYSGTGLGELEFEFETNKSTNYIIEFDTETNSEKGISLTIGEEPIVDSYNGDTHMCIGIKSNGGKLRFIPKENWNNVLKNVTLKELSTNGENEVILDVRNISNGNMTNLLTGFWNVSIGPDSMLSNQNGSRNVAIGLNSMVNLKSGTRNIAIGTFSMPFITEGDRNIAIGADSLYSVDKREKSVAYDNVAIGKACMSNGELVRNNVAIGTNALANNTENAENNVSIGYNAGYYADADNTHVGYNAGYYTKGKRNASLGSKAGSQTYVTGDDNVAVGYNSGIDNTGCSAQNVKNVSNTVAIGSRVKVKNSNEARIGNNEQTVFLAGKKIIFNEDGSVTWEAEY